MKLHRLATIYFPGKRLPLELRSWDYRVGAVLVRTLSSYELENERVRILVSADVTIDRPAVTTDGWLMVPETPRRQCEFAIEVAANTLAVSRRCWRSISSPHPVVALEGDTAEEAAWLAAQAGIQSLAASRTMARAPINVSTALTALSGRLDGLFLMAEALAHDHPTGKFHEFTRLFERAFKRSGDRLTKPLSEFLAGTPHSFTRREVEQWTIRLRHPLTHADIKDEILLQTDARKVIGRMEEAAYDVLFNKAEWRHPSTTRRTAMKHLAGTVGPTSNLFLTQGVKEQFVEAQLLDDFGSFPSDASAGLRTLPEGWWAKFSNQRPPTESP